MDDDTSKKRPAEEEPTGASKKPRSSDTMEESDEEDNVFASDAPSKEDRRSSLSKFVRRMLDPNREPRGLIEPPQVIPLNDEFLQAFGQREKKFDSQIGRSSEFDQAIQDMDDANFDASVAKQAEEKQAKDETNSRKVKIANLKYTTTQAVLKEECLNFGPVEEVTLLMDETNPTRNIGRAYVLFETAEAAQSCVDQQLGGALDGRPIRVSLAESAPQRGGGSKEKRYWQKDISTKCFRCGQVGHMADDCKGQMKATVCPLCAKPDDHELRNCPLNRICFNCGIPGHINRECSVPRGSQPKRQICTLCCGSGHDRFQCQRSATNIPGIRDAICLVCHQKGHFLCKELKWFFGLDGVFCFNCGGKGHVGNQCNRPTLDDLCRDAGWTLKEVERGQEYKLADEMELERMERDKKERERQQKRQQERDRQRNRYRDRDRARSAPPQRPGQGYYDDFTAGYNGEGGGNEYRYNIDDNNNNNSNRGYRNNNNNNRQGGRRRGYR